MTYDQIIVLYISGIIFSVILWGIYACYLILSRFPGLIDFEGKIIYILNNYLPHIEIINALKNAGNNNIHVIGTNKDYIDALHLKFNVEYTHVNKLSDLTKLHTKEFFEKLKLNNVKCLEEDYEKIIIINTYNIFESVFEQILYHNFIYKLLDKTSKRKRVKLINIFDNEYNILIGEFIYNCYHKINTGFFFDIQRFIPVQNMFINFTTKYDYYELVAMFCKNVSYLTLKDRFFHSISMFNVNMN